MRLELDGKQQLVAFALDQDGRSTAPAPKPDQLFDANLVATLIPFIQRAKPGAKTEVTGATIDGGGKQTPVTYAFDRTGATFVFTADGPFGLAPGTITLDGDGLPKSNELKAGSAALEITRQ